MSKIDEYVWKDDPLKTVSGLIAESNFGSSGPDKETPINAFLLLMACVFLAITKSVYGQAGFTLTQHFVSSLVLIFGGYIGVGVALLAMGASYTWVINRLRCVLTCFLAALVTSLLFVYFSEKIIDGGITFVELFTTSNWWADRLPNAAPALLFSAIGCLAIYRIKIKKEEDTRWVTRGAFMLYWFITTVTFYFVAFDRGWFFDNVMRHIANIKII